MPSVAFARGGGRRLEALRGAPTLFFLVYRIVFESLQRGISLGMNGFVIDGIPMCFCLLVASHCSQTATQLARALFLRERGEDGGDAGESLSEGVAVTYVRET